MPPSWGLDSFHLPRLLSVPTPRGEIARFLAPQSLREREEGAGVWTSASGEGAASSPWNRAKLKCQSRGRRRLSVFRGCRDASGPQGAPPSHWWGCHRLLGSGSALWVRRGGARARGARLWGCGCAPGAGSQLGSAGPCCSWAARNPGGGGGPRSLWDPLSSLLALHHLASVYLLGTTDKDASVLDQGPLLRGLNPKSLVILFPFRTTNFPVAFVRSSCSGGQGSCNWGGFGR